MISMKLFVIVLLLVATVDSILNFESILSKELPPQYDTVLRHHLKSRSVIESEYCLSRRKYLISGKCYTLPTKGWCPKKEWMVLENVDGSSRKPNGSEKIVCKKRPCNVIREVWWPEESRCVSKSLLKKGPCKGEGKFISLDMYGNGVCSCISTHGEMMHDDKKLCFEYYKRGPCKFDEVVTYDSVLESVICARDKCYEENTKDARKYQPPVNKRAYAPLDGKCYRLGSAEPCGHVNLQSRFILDPETLVPSCSLPNIALYLIDSPTLCKSDEKNKCRSPVNITVGDRWDHLKKNMKKPDENDSIHLMLGESVNGTVFNNTGIKDFFEAVILNKDILMNIFSNEKSNNFTQVINTTMNTDSMLYRRDVREFFEAVIIHEDVLKEILSEISTSVKTDTFDKKVKTEEIFNATGIKDFFQAFLTQKDVLREILSKENSTTKVNEMSNKKDVNTKLELDDLFEDVVMHKNILHKIASGDVSHSAMKDILNEMMKKEVFNDTGIENFFSAVITHKHVLKNITSKENVNNTTNAMPNENRPYKESLNEAEMKDLIRTVVMHKDVLKRVTSGEISLSTIDDMLEKTTAKNNFNETGIKDFFKAVITHKEDLKNITDNVTNHTVVEILDKTMNKEVINIMGKNDSLKTMSQQIVSKENLNKTMEEIMITEKAFRPNETYSVEKFNETDVSLKANETNKEDSMELSLLEKYFNETAPQLFGEIIMPDNDNLSLIDKYYSSSEFRDDTSIDIMNSSLTNFNQKA